MAKKQDQNGMAIAQPSSHITISLPIHSCWPGWAGASVQFHASRRQAAAMKILLSSLSADTARFDGGTSSNPDGTVVDASAHVFKFILDRVADAIEQATGKELLTDFALEFGRDRL